MDAVFGQMLTVEQDGLFTTSEEVQLLWIRSGSNETALVSAAVGTSSDAATFFAPELPEGSYSVLFDLGPVLGLVQVELRAGMDVPDPEAEIALARASVANGIADAESALSTVEDSSLAAALANDLERAQELLQEFDQAIAVAEPEDIEAIAAWLDANASVFQPAEFSLTSSALGQFLDEGAAIERAATEMVVAMAKIVLGVSFVVAAILAAPSVLGALALAAVGISLVAEGRAQYEQARIVPLISPILRLGFGDEAQSRETGGGLRVISGGTLPVSFEGEAESVSRSHGVEPRISALLDESDRIAATFSGLSAEARSFISAEFSAIGEPQTITPVLLDASRVSVQSSNPLTSVSLDGGVLTFSSDSDQDEETTLAFHYTSTLSSGLGSSVASIVVVIEPRTIEGTWSFQETSLEISSGCDDDFSGEFLYTGTITRDGNAITLVTEEGTYSGAISGGRVTFSGSRPDPLFGLTTFFDAELDIGCELDCMLGTAAWMSEDLSGPQEPPEFCTGTTSISATRAK